jgi:hypothetical protein
VPVVKNVSISIPFFEAQKFCLYLLKVEGVIGSFKKLKQFSIFALSKHTNFSQIQTGARIPLMYEIKRITTAH